MNEDIHQRLRAAFQAESAEHLERMRSILAGAEKASPEGPDLEEVFRRAHSLKGAARAVGLDQVQTLAHHLESLFSQVREGSLSFSADVLARIGQALDDMEDLVAVFLRGGTPDGPLRSQAGLEQVLNRASEEALPAEINALSQASTTQLPAPLSSASPSAMETMRVSTEGLDRLLRSANQLLTEVMRQDLIGQKVAEVSRQVADMDRAWKRVRSLSAPVLRRLSDAPEFARLARYLDFTNQQVQTLSERIGAVRALQRHSAMSLHRLGNKLQGDVRRTRMVPAGSAFEGFRKMVRDLAQEEGKEIAFEVHGLDVEADRMVLQALKDPLMHLLRNAISHGIETPAERARSGKSPKGRVSLQIDAPGNRLRAVVSDDGRGLQVAEITQAAIARGVLSAAEAAETSPEERVRLIFRPGVSTAQVVTELSGRGMGLSVVYEAVVHLQGSVEIQQVKGPGVAIALSAPLSIVTHYLLLVSCQEQRFCIPTHGIDRLHRIGVQDVKTIEGKQVVQLGKTSFPIFNLAYLLNTSTTAMRIAGGMLPVAILKSGEKRIAVAVDAFHAVREGIIQDLAAPAARQDIVSGGILLEDGAVSPVLNPAGLVEIATGSQGVPDIAIEAPKPEPRPNTILVVDDSITTRTLEKSILEAHGYRVVVAVDGVEALAQLRLETVDLIVADIQMPRMDGFVLLREIKQDKRLTHLPVILVTSMDRREDRERGLNLGADAYIVKQKFDQRDLLETIEQML